MAKTTPHRFALIPAAGGGVRFGGAVPKQYILLAGVPLLKHAIESLRGAIDLDAMFVVLAANDDLYADCIGNIPGVELLACGGATRAESVRNGLAAIDRRAEADDWIIVHDAVRPCIDAATLHRLVHELQDEPVGGLLALPVADTLKRAEIGAGRRAETTEAREGLWCAQTPQMFRHAILQQALRQADLTKITDEAQAIEGLGMKPRLVQGSSLNIKVTYPEDIALAEAILAHRKPRA